MKKKLLEESMPDIVGVLAGLMFSKIITSHLKKKYKPIDPGLQARLKLAREDGHPTTA